MIVKSSHCPPGTPLVILPAEERATWKNHWCHFSLPSVLNKASSRALTESHISKCPFCASSPWRSLNSSASGSCKWCCKYQKCPKHFQESLSPQQPATGSTKATASSQAEDELHFTYSNEKVWQSMQHMHPEGTAQSTVDSIFFWKQMLKHLHCPPPRNGFDKKPFNLLLGKKRAT